LSSVVCKSRSLILTKRPARITKRRYTTQNKEYFALDPLPYPKTALVPHISEETIEFHYGKHHAAYVTNLNALVHGTDHANKSLVELIKTTKGPVFNNAAQIWNHTFFWNSMSPQGGGQPTGELAEMITKDFGSYKDFQEKFTEEAKKHFGSGWAWLVMNAEGKLSIVSTHDAANPMQDGLTPLLTCDVWEHAYYIDYRNARPKYLESWWKLVNWKFAENNIKSKKSL